MNPQIDFLEAINKNRINIINCKIFFMAEQVTAIKRS